MTTPISSAAIAKLSPKRFLFLGAPGVGKGTYASRVSAGVGIPHISSGDLLRAEVKKGSEIGRQVKGLIDQGKFVPDELMTEMMLQAVSKQGDQGYLLDGFPRTLKQAEHVDAAGVLKIDHVINLRQPFEVITEKLSQRRSCADCGKGYNFCDIDMAGIRMTPLAPKVEGVCDDCGSTKAFLCRADDEKEVVERRLALYQELAGPLESFYQKQGKLVHFDVLGGPSKYLGKLVDKLCML